MAEHHYKFNVAMSCGGCSGAVERVLKKLDGELLVAKLGMVYIACVSLGFLAMATYFKYFHDHPLTCIGSAVGVKSFDVSLDTQTADVVAEESLAYETVLSTIKKTGKTVKSGEADGEVRSVD